MSEITAEENETEPHVIAPRVYWIRRLAALLILLLLHCFAIERMHHTRFASNKEFGPTTEVEVKPRENRRSLSDGLEHPCRFEQFFSGNKVGPGIHKWEHYFDAYEREFGRYCKPNSPQVNMIEIGIQSGGSIRMWRDRIDHNLKCFVGVDINPATTAWEEFGSNIHVVIGSQDKADTWQQVNATCAGGFDIILDDGSHIANHIWHTFAMVFPTLLKPGGVYLIEDLTKENYRSVKMILRNYSHKTTRFPLLESFYHQGDQSRCCAYETNGAQAEIEYITEYPMMLAVRKRSVIRKSFQAIKQGSQWIPYKTNKTKAALSSFAGGG